MITASELVIGYEQKIVVNGFEINVNEGEFVSIIGPNGSGKSTVLKVISRLLKQKSGAVYLHGNNMSSMSTKEIAKKLAILSQVNSSPEDFTVEELIYYGRTPHKKWFESRNKEDEEKVKWAISHTKLNGFEDRKVSRLSGGERQRVWLAMALAQEPKVLLLDEPTTYLDICHQLEVMELVQELNKELGITVVTVLHDLNQAAKYSDRVVVIKDGQLVKEGSPGDILTKDLIRDVYRVETDICLDTRTKKPTITLLGIAKNLEKRCKNA